jgi:rhamnulokinase
VAISRAYLAIGLGAESGRVVVGPYEATALGNALVQAMAAGDVKDLRELRQFVARSFDLTPYEPAGSADWGHAAERTRLW